MTEQEILDCLNNVRDNLSYYGDREMYEKIFLTVADIYTFCTYDLELDIVDCRVKYSLPPIAKVGEEFIF